VATLWQFDGTQCCHAIFVIRDVKIMQIALI
jgi:hypothetical protein